MIVKVCLGVEISCHYAMKFVILLLEHSLFPLMYSNNPLILFLFYEVKNQVCPLITKMRMFTLINLNKN